MRQTGIIYLSTQAPSELGDELMLAGFRVWEALSESEVQHLCETEDIDALVIAHDVPMGKRIGNDSRRICVMLQPTTKTADLVWELIQLFPRPDSVVQ